MLDNMENLYKICESADEIIVFGAGRVGYSLLQYLGQNSFLEKVFCIMVTDKNNNPDNILGIPVCSIGDVGIRKQAVVLLATFEKVQDVIVNRLSSEHYEAVYKIKNILYAELRRQNYTYEPELLFDIHGMKKDIEKVKKELYSMIQKVDVNIGYTREVLEGINFNRSMNYSEWCCTRDFKTGEAAVNNKYMYTLFKILDSNRFSSFLDIGMGQTTKMIAQYVNKNEGAKLCVVEDNQEWIDFITPSLGMKENFEIIKCDCELVEYNGVKVRKYVGFKEKLEGKIFDYISIDAPIGYDMTEYSRIDLLELLPHCLADSWVLMIDDVERAGENNTVDKIGRILEDNGIEYAVGFHFTDKKVAIFTSKDNKFFCTV